jgi:glycosyltransferase involved in cell wall biosynthesis
MVPSARVARLPSLRRFVHLSFEGPDPYSSAGGLAVRVTNLAEALSRSGDPVDLYFVGDPDLPGVEQRGDVTLGVVELAFPIAGRQLRTFYSGVDAVLANSGFEPFGLVGLEAMASRGIVIAGATGEDYLSPFHNGFALDTDDACEILRCLDWLDARGDRAATLRRRAHETARRYRWADVSDRLLLSLGLAE